MFIARHLKRILLSTILGLGFIYLGFSLLVARMTVFPWWYVRSPVDPGKLPGCSPYLAKIYVHCQDPKQNLDLDFQDFSIEREGVRTSGWWVPVAKGVRAKATVVLVHGGGGDRRALLKHVKYLHEAGYQALLIDCHNHGLSGRDGRGLSLGVRESQSVILAVEWARQNIPGAVALPMVAMGTSQGAFAALRAMAESPEISAVIAENPYASVRRLILEFSPLRHYPRIVKEGAFAMLSFYLGHSVEGLSVARFAEKLGSRPVLLIHGDSDEVTPESHSREILEVLSGPKELLVVKGGEHEYLWNLAPKSYEDKVLHFLDTAASVSPPSQRRY